MNQLSLFPISMDPASLNGWGRTVTSRLCLYSGTADPVATEIPKSQWIIYKNTTLNEIRLWVNDNGTLKKSVALT